MQLLILIAHVIAAAAIIGLVLIQHGKGADMGASFGAGASQTVFGSQGTGSFLFRMTAVCAAVFFATSLVLNAMATNAVKQTTLSSAVKTQLQQKQS